MPLPILILARVAILYFARVDLLFRDGHHFLCQGPKILEGRWVGFAHALSVFDPASERNSCSVFFGYAYHFRNARHSVHLAGTEASEILMEGAQ